MTWHDKHPCKKCGVGYGDCSRSGVRMCCMYCGHPTRWQPNPWTSQDLREMWAGEEMPEFAREALAKLVKEESSAPADSNHPVEELSGVSPYL